MNPYPATLMATNARRAELCRILALGLIRLHMRQSSELSDVRGESCLRSPPDQSAHATDANRRTA
jgi:hypothetical protein